MRRSGVILVLLALLAPPALAQGLRDQIGQLFIFGSGEDPLFLAGTADPDNPANVQVHGSHFIPSAVESNATVISFLTDAISTNIANIPISATSSGQTFSFEGGIPVATSTSPGPIFAERAQTLGRGRVLVGATINVFNFTSVRGVDLDNVKLNFTHANGDFPGCDALVGGDCTLYGIPDVENDFIALDLDLDIDVVARLFVLTFGLHDRVDIGVAVPVVTTSFKGTSAAQVVPFGPPANHFFGGTLSDPDLFASRVVEGSATGLGDIAARLKVAVSESQHSRFAILADARLATGNEADLLGAGDPAIRGLGILSAQFGNFSPHANVGYMYRAGDLQTDAFLSTVGFDHVLAPWATLAVDLVSELQVGDNKLTLPEPVELEAPFRRMIDPTSIPDERDDIVNGSLGFKFVTPSGVTLIANSIWALNQGGMRSAVVWTAGLEYNF